MGLFKSSSDKPAEQTGSDKKSLYQRYQDSKRGEPISDADLLKYTGKTRDEFDSWKDTQPGVGRNQLAGTLAMGNAAGLAGGRLGTRRGAQRSQSRHEVSAGAAAAAVRQGEGARAERLNFS
ncbi:hypothetical protein BBO_08592 [Beauveria brongniartii RCEF 3172]|uniref:Uncharacterized protein n=1 Tax=Beauveria brongniartii RCEF 3172 TaxID=1081107 RepID=A0A166XFA6_9HYPO|nr:hypothetical protein BBO_08592 [Beauveria brongniartii RCEF 3172]